MINKCCEQPKKLYEQDGSDWELCGNCLECYINEEEEDKYAKCCDNCKKGMFEGYIIGGNYYCNDECRRVVMSDKEWEAHYEDGGDDYWSEWHELDEGGYYTEDGKWVED
jgi:hypothetical protein